MNTDALKEAWKKLDRKVQATNLLNERLILSMIADRSKNRFQSVKRNYWIGFGWLAFCMCAGLMVIIGNPFDYTYLIQFVPMIIYCVCLVVIVVNMFLSYRRLNNITIDYASVRSALAEIIAIYERPQKFMKYILYVFIVSQTILFPLSFLPKNIDNLGFWPAMFERLIPISIAFLILFIAYKLGAFKDRQSQKFKDDLNELDQLKAVIKELD
ncbi:hypothetical protein [Pseudochryseolinea flava]|uniref:Uncharacterized protein n=1 Tax=Pseudochryseolinea flava TaxID=2059302 RepID=A0A364Y9I3_9BACT|nr:hypothetical protein [Pseudochryseolinea flava]RAW02882.1 hypothetical protein DQQ10_01880 [Pseudochryseolinea flava]